MSGCVVTYMKGSMSRLQEFMYNTIHTHTQRHIYEYMKL